MLLAYKKARLTVSAKQMLTAVDHIIVLLLLLLLPLPPAGEFKLGTWEGMRSKTTGICEIPEGELLPCLTSHLNFSRLSKCLQTSFYN